MISRNVAVAALALQLLGAAAPAVALPTPPVQAAASATALPASGAYKIDPTHAQVRMSWNHLGLSNPGAVFETVEGVVRIDEANPERSSVAVRIPVSGVDTGVPQLDADFLTDKFFDAARHPDITFQSRSVERVGLGRAFKVHGDLTGARRHPSRDPGRRSERRGRPSHDRRAGGRLCSHRRPEAFGLRPDRRPAHGERRDQGRDHPRSRRGSSRSLMTDQYLLIGRILLVLLFLQSGITKSIRFQEGLGEVRAKKIPFAHLALLGTIVLQLAGSALLIAGWFTTPVAALMALFTLATAVVFYDFWSVKGEARTAALNGFFEHISIIGGFLILMAAGPGRFVL